MISRTDIEDMTEAQDEGGQWQRSEAELRLLPCPFCGNDGAGPIEDALHIAFNEHDSRPPSWSVQCDKCTANMGYSDSEDEAVEAWNRRADLARPSQAGDERVARLQNLACSATTMIAHALDDGHIHEEVAGNFETLLTDLNAALAAMDTPKGGGDE